MLQVWQLHTATSAYLCIGSATSSRNATIFCTAQYQGIPPLHITVKWLKNSVRFCRCMYWKLKIFVSDTQAPTKKQTKAGKSMYSTIPASPRYPRAHTSRIRLALLQLLLSGDIQTNPGPQARSIFSCGYCERPVEWGDTRDHRTLMCESCDVWYHVNCIEMCSN